MVLHVLLKMKTRIYASPAVKGLSKSILIYHRYNHYFILTIHHMHFIISATVRLQNTIMQAVCPLWSDSNSIYFSGDTWSCLSSRSLLPLPFETSWLLLSVLSVDMWISWCSSFIIITLLSSVLFVSPIWRSGKICSNHGITTFLIE